VSSNHWLCTLPRDKDDAAIVDLLTHKSKYPHPKYYIKFSHYCFSPNRKIVIHKIANLFTNRSLRAERNHHTF